MANWKKMAEAFGRALGRPDIRNEMNTIGKNSKQAIKDRQELFDTMNRSAVSNNAEDEFMTGLMRAEDDNTEIARRAGNRDMSYDERQREFDKRTDQRTDEALNKEWDDAFKQSTDKFKAQSSLLDDEDADVWRSELLRTIDILRKRGFSDSDILNTIKGK